MPSLTDYDPLADRYASGVDTQPWNAYYERPLTLSLLPPVDGLEVLDAGCGPGWYSEWLLKNGARVTAYDRSKRMADLTRLRCGPAARVLAAETEQLPDLLPQDHFHIVLASLVVHYIIDLDPVFRIWNGLMKTGGRLLLSSHHPLLHLDRVAKHGYFDRSIVTARWEWLDRTVSYVTRPISDLVNSLSGAGFVILRLEEGLPQQRMKHVDPQSFQRLMRFPGFLHILARKD